MKQAAKTIITAAVLINTFVLAQNTQPETVLVNRVNNITSSATVIDNRSTFIAQNTVHTFCGYGSGSWSATIQYSDVSAAGPWTNFSDATASISNSSTQATCGQNIGAMGGGTGYHQFIRFNISGTVSVSYSGQKTLWVPFPLPTGTTNFSGIASGTNTTATMIVGSGASLSYTGSGYINASLLDNVPLSGLLQSANNLSDLANAATARVNIGITQANIQALWNGSGCTTPGNALLIGNTCGATMIYPGAGVPNSTGSAWTTSYQVGLAANNLSQYNSSDILPIGQGLLQGYGMTGTGLDTPTVNYLADGTLASPSSSTYPAATWSRITNANYTNGLAEFVMYSLKNGGSNGIETFGISTREILPSNQVSEYIRTVGSYGYNAITSVTTGTPTIINLGAPCYCTTGQSINISGSTGISGLNTDWVVTVISSTQLSLNGSSLSGTYGGSGLISLQGPWTITNATGAAPIVITTDVPYNLGLNSSVQISGVTGVTAANGNWAITPITNTTFSLQFSNGLSATYTGGGTATFFSTNWSIVAACSKFWVLDECTNETNTFNNSGVDAPVVYGSGPGLMNGWAIVGGGNAKLSEALYIDSQARTVAVWQRGIDMVNGALLANAPALLIPNLSRISSYNVAGNATTDLMWQDSSLDTVFNTNSSGFMYFAVNGVAKASMDNAGDFDFLTFAATPRLTSAIGTCTSAALAKHVWVTDSPTNIYGATVTVGGGAYTVGLVCNGTNWSVYAAGAASGGSGCVTSGTSILYGNGSGGCANVSIGANLSFSGGVLSATGGSGGALNGTRTANTASDAFLSSDTGKLIDRTYTSGACTESLSAASTSGFTSPWTAFIENNCLGALTVTATTSVFILPAGTTASSIIIAPGQGVSLWSDSTDYHVAGTWLTPVQGITISNNQIAVDPTYVQINANVQNGQTITLTETSSSPTAYTFSMNPTLAAYPIDTAHMPLLPWHVITACTGSTSTTGNISTLGARGIVIPGGSNPGSSDCSAGLDLTLSYDAAFTEGTITSITTGSTTTLTFAVTPSAILAGSVISISGATGTGCSGLNSSFIVSSIGPVVIPFNSTGCTYGASSASATVPALVIVAGRPVSGSGGTCSGDINSGCSQVTNLSHVTNASLTNSGLANPSVTVNGTTCTLGSTCTPPGAASAFAALTDAATVTWAIGSAPTANVSLTFTVHSGSRTLNLTGPVNGGNYVLWIKQDSTGGEGLTLGTGCTWKVSGGGAGAITPSVAANAIDILAFTYDGTNCYANFNKNFN